ncbi:MAG TPA: nucleotidyltransferase family protein [Gaiellaceae bacterium]|jgi:glucose-1-phosphate thymidylyltransferase
MRAIVLAAGYATRLYPLTQTIAKPLLPVGGRPMLDHIVDRVAEVDEIDRVHVVTNRKFADSFLRWAEERGGRLPIEVHDDGTTSEDDRLGAIGDVQFVVDAAGLADTDLLVIAGDNLFDFSLADLVGYWHGKGEASAIGLYDVGDLELVKQYGVVELDADGRMVSMVEKPPEPRSTLAATATYLYHRAHVPLVRAYLDEGNSPDQPGRFIVWLHTRAPVYGYRFTGEWLDVGDRGQLLEADNRLRARTGMPPRAEYSLD